MSVAAEMNDGGGAVDLAKLGTDLELRLASLSAEGLRIGPGERTKVWALTHELVRLGRVKRVEDLEPYLSAVLARTPGESRRFQIAATAPTAPDAPTPQRPHKAVVEAPAVQPKWWPRARWAAAFAASLVVALVLYDQAQQLDPTIGDAGSTAPVVASGPVGASSATANESLARAEPEGPAAEAAARILDAAARFGADATLGDLAEILRFEGVGDTTVAARTVTISALSGLSLDRPVGVCVAPGAVDQPNPLEENRAANLARTLDLIERPDAVQPLSAYREAVRTATLPVCSSRPATPLSRDAVSALPRTIAVLVALLLGVAWLRFRYRSERPYLRRRKPKRTPTRTTHIAKILAERHVWRDPDRRLTQVLLRRDSVEAPQIDVRRSIDATLKGGGRLIRLERARLKPQPEYLVLLESRGAGDQTAARLEELLAPFGRDGLVKFNVYTYQSDPAYAAPLHRGAFEPIEAVYARYPDHRLIILGAGRGIAYGPDGLPSRAAETLRLWPRRALLTPTPLSEWSAAEFAIARTLDAPVGRATKEGFYQLGLLLGLDDSAPDKRPDPSGDGGLAPMPDALRLQPERMLMSRAPRDYDADAVLRDLKRFLDPDGFRWLAALAVYPALQWDLTLYLGLELDLYRDDRAGDRRLSTLSRLPWLEAGQMPKWLRIALIGALSDEDGSRIYTAIIDALKAVEEEPETRDRRLVLNVGRDDDLFADPSPTPLDDEVLVDFLRRGDEGDLPLPRNWPSPAQDQMRVFWSRYATWRTVAATGATAAAAWSLSPAPGSAPTTGAVAPVVTLFAAAAAAFALDVWLERDPTKTRRQRRRLASKGAAEPKKSASEEAAPPARPAPGMVFRDPLRAGGQGPAMVSVAGGAFLMGSPETEAERRENEGPQHRVSVPPFALGRTPVTFEDFDLFAAATGAEKPNDRGCGRGRRPVIYVSWEDAQAYCAWLSSQTGEPYRLPSEAEWEYACRAGTTTRFSFGDGGSALGTHAWFSQNSGRKTQPVGGKQPNGFDLFDMHGNVWEWTEDCWNDTYQGAPTDGSAWTSGDCSGAVLRGGSWDYEPRLLRSAFRGRSQRSDRDDDVGFRVARTFTR